MVRWLPTSAVGVLLACILSLAACGPAGGTASAFFVKVVNVDGPPVEVDVNGTMVGQRSCQSPDLTLAAGDPSVGGFPWTIDIRHVNGPTLRTVDIGDGSGKPQIILIRGDGVLVGDYPASYGPAPILPCPG